LLCLQRPPYQGGLGGILAFAVPPLSRGVRGDCCVCNAPLYQGGLGGIVVSVANSIAVPASLYPPPTDVTVMPTSSHRHSRMCLAGIQYSRNRSCCNVDRDPPTHPSQPTVHAHRQSPPPLWTARACPRFPSPTTQPTLHFPKAAASRRTPYQKSSSTFTLSYLNDNTVRRKPSGAFWRSHPMEHHR